MCVVPKFMCACVVYARARVGWTGWLDSVCVHAFVCACVSACVLVKFCGSPTFLLSTFFTNLQDKYFIYSPIILHIFISENSALAILRRAAPIHIIMYVLSTIIEYYSL